MTDQPRVNACSLGQHIDLTEPADPVNTEQMICGVTAAEWEGMTPAERGRLRCDGCGHQNRSHNESGYCWTCLKGLGPCA